MLRHLIRKPLTQLEAASVLSKMAMKGPPRIAPKGRTFSIQYNLPRLPVPALESTLNKYLESCRPLLDEEQFKTTEEVIKKFQRNEGPKLQKLLEERANNHVNWLSDWWKSVAYLDFRLPVVINVSPGIAFFKQDYSGLQEQLDYTARCIAGALDFKIILDEQNLPVETLRGKPLCMYQHYTLLTGCRIPGLKRDTHSCVPQDDPNPPKHINVIHKNHIFSVEVFGKQGKPLSIAQIREQLQSCVDQSKVRGPPVGMLTTMDRASWGKVYASLMKDKTNKASLENIQRSLFVVCLDGPSEPSDFDTHATRFMHGNGSNAHSANRWFDKTLQFIFGPEGYSGLCYEHTSAEGPPIIGIADHMVEFAQRKQDAWIGAAEVWPPKRLNFNLSDKVMNVINQAEKELDSMCEDLMMRTFFFDGYGKNFIKSQKLSPDAFIQVAIQLAYYKYYSQPCGSYESGSLRRFQLGRTETIRPCSNASLAFTKAMCDSNVDGATKVDLLRKAVDAHRKYTDDVVAGQGVDRHLLGLKLTALEQGMDIPAIFMDWAFKESTHFRLSTSQVAAKNCAFLCFGPVVPDGYGVCYNPQDDAIAMGISSYNNSPETNSDLMVEQLRQAFMDMQAILVTHTKAKL